MAATDLGSPGSKGEVPRVASGGSYLTWGSVAGDWFDMFRRAKLMLADLPADTEQVTVDVDLTDEHGMPRCARLRPPAIQIA